jgi:YegS/Rv2252/BmrU family lipid kinase
MARSACLIFNPVCGQGDPQEDLAKIRALLEPELELNIQMTTAELFADHFAREAVEQGFDLIIACGGDGTLSAAADALVNTGIPLGVISRGTANAFAAALGLPETIEAACEAILTGTVRKVDAACCNGDYMVLLTGIGFEAETIERADRDTKNRFGMLAYFIAGLQELRELEHFAVEIETDDKQINVTASAVTIANIAPPTSILAQGPGEMSVDDGLLDMTIVAPSNTVNAIAASYHLLQSALSGNRTNRPDIGYVRSKTFKVTTDPPQKVAVDGELIGMTPVEVECIPGGLLLIVPVTQPEEPGEKLLGLPDLVITPKE